MEINSSDALKLPNGVKHISICPQNCILHVIIFKIVFTYNYHTIHIYLIHISFYYSLDTDTDETIYCAHLGAKPSVIHNHKQVPFL